MFTLRFTEFCRIFKCEKMLKTIDFYGGSNEVDYAKLEKLYNIYLKIGGYLEIVNRSEVANAVTWLKYVGILQTCNLAVDGDMININESRKAYFSDCGIASYLADKRLVEPSSLIDIITQTFVYNKLH